MNYESILAIGAHPDDVEYGCLGFLLANKNQSNIHVYVASVGSVADPTPGRIRVEETSRALSILTPKNLEIRHKKGIIDENFQEILSDLEYLIEKTRPTLILTHGPHDTHQEHKLLYDISISAARRKKLSMLRYSIVSNTSYFQPNYFFEFSEEILNQKMHQLSYHKTQADKNYMTKEFLINYHLRPYSYLHGIKYCEAYEVERIMN